MARLASFIVATLVTLLSTLAAAADQQDLPKQLTLSQAITIALSNNSILHEAQSRLDEASGRHEQSRSPLLPQLELDAHQSYQTINLIGLGIDIPTVPQGKTNPFASMDARLLLRQDLLNIANWNAWKSSGSQQESFRVLVDNSRELVVLDVVATYLQALRAKAFSVILFGFSAWAFPQAVNKWGDYDNTERKSRRFQLKAKRERL